MSIMCRCLMEGLGQFFWCGDDSMDKSLTSMWSLRTIARLSAMIGIFLMALNWAGGALVRLELTRMSLGLSPLDRITSCWAWCAERLERQHFRAANVVCLLTILMTGISVRAAEPETGPPVWTLAPTHIDREKQTYDRLPAHDPNGGYVPVVVDRPVRFASDGSFTIGGQPARIAGVALPDRQTLCETPTGGRWACGLRAVNAYIALLVAPGLQCLQSSPTGGAVNQLKCQRSKEDIAERLVGDGWASAEVDAESVLKLREQSARAARLGLWQDMMPNEK